MRTSAVVKGVAQLSAVILLAGLAACSSGGTSKSGTPAGDKIFSGRELILADYGGPLSANEKKFFADPFAAETGATVKFVDSSDPNALAFLQSKNNNVKLDIVLGASAILADNGYLADFPAKTVDLFKETLRPDTFTSNIMEKGLVAVVIACNPKIMAKCPKNPKEFWDLKGFPGPRAAIADPEYNMNIGLLADGVEPSAINPPDIAKAIASWQKVKSGIKVWSTSGAQQMQLMTDGEVGAQIMYNGRAFIVQRDKMPDLQISWDNCTLGGVSGYGVLSGAPNKEVAFGYLEWIAKHPKAQAQWAESVTYSVPGKDVLSHMPKKVADAMPEAHNCPSVVDNSWRNKNSAEVKKQWQSFLGK